MKFIIIPIIASVISQLIKIIIEFIKYKKLTLTRLIDGMGGMPSTHSTLVSSLSTIIYINYGISPIFAITLIFSLVIIYDSMGIRYESGKQAEVINDIAGTNLEEKLGHKPIEVLIGTIIGIVLTIIIELLV